MGTRWERREAPWERTVDGKHGRGTLNPANLYTKRRQIAELARRKPGVALYSLSHVIDMEWMLESYRLTRKGGAPRHRRSRSGGV